MSAKTTKLWPFYVPPLLMGGYLLVKCLYVMLSRVSYPYELEWIESAMLQVTMRVVDGLPIYAPPSMEYVPPLYAPLYFYVSALAIKIVGVGLPALRGVSLLASLCTAGLVVCSIWQLTRSRLAVLLGICCWAALYALSGTYYDLARVDSLWACFLTGTVTGLICFFIQKKNIFLVQFLLCLLLSVFTKQTTLFLLPFFFLALWCMAGFRTVLVSGLVLIALIGSALLVMQWQSGGLFYFYVMEIARSHGFNQGIPANFLLGDMLFGLPVYLLLCAVFIVCYSKSLRVICAWLLLFSGYFLMSMLSRWYTGGWFNVLIPFHQLIVIMAVVGFWWLLQRLQGVQNKGIRYFLLCLCSVLLVLNIARGWVTPSYSLPTMADRACGDALVSAIAASPAEKVCVFRHPYLARLAGKQDCAHEALAVDLLNGGNAQMASELRAETQRKLADGFYPLLLVDSDGQFAGYGVPWKKLAYTATDIDMCAADVFFPKVSGQRPRHWLIYNGAEMVDKRAGR